MTLLCLHTAATNIALFDDAARALDGPQPALSHMVMPHLLAEAERSGGMTAQQQLRLDQLLHSLAPWCEAILITCSTLGPAADAFRQGAHRCPVYRTDRMLADHVHRLAGTTRVFCAAESTLGATQALFCPPGLPVPPPQVELIPDAWAAFKRGDHLRYHALIIRAVEQAYAQGAQQVALAQVSMAAAAQSMPAATRPLTIPSLALQTVISLGK